ncbi:uncharacterized protein LOC109200627 isoform X3 [Oreochromis niloticus]|uniref:uncharacterized protein LOC109200627 isoform X3 n=1 Tax=Oreochromis niloticus TaxID=8128 RepID=UPI0009053AAB|nr:uncharacterized protein LOC109200627 isoform X3 [Oreochromis niloticus]
MPTYATDGEWTLVRRRRGRRGDRDWRAEEIARRPPRRSSYPSREGRRTYTAIRRDDHRSGESDFFHAPQRNRGRNQPAADRYAARQESWRGDRGWGADEDARRPPRRSSHPSREGRRTYAAVVREEHRNGQPGFFHAPQRNRGGTVRHRTAMQPARRAGEETAAGELRRTYADHLDAAATHLEKVGGPMRRPWERITAATSRTFSTHHSGAGGENSRRQTAMQPGKEVGPDGTDDSNGERLGTIGLKDHIPALTSDIFTTEEDDIHWSYGTSEAMLQHWEMNPEVQKLCISDYM